MDPEQPEADVLEQGVDTADTDPDDAARGTATLDVFTDPDGFPTEANPADVAEQRAVVPQDVDEP